MPIDEEMKIITEFIDCYRGLPMLWDPDHIDYPNKRKRAKAYMELVPIFRGLKSDATIDDVKRKINSLRTGYRREKKRQKRLRESSNHFPGGKEEGPTLWWFHQLTFMDHILERNSKAEVTNDFADQSQMSETEMPFTSVKYNFEDVSMPVSSDSKQHNESDFQTREVRLNAGDKRQSYFKKDDTENDADIFGRAWSIQYRNLSNDQKIFAKKAIDDVLFEARLGTLHRHSIKINDSLCQHCQTAFINTEYSEVLDSEIHLDDH